VHLPHFRQCSSAWLRAWRPGCGTRAAGRGAGVRACGLAKQRRAPARPVSAPASGEPRHVFACFTANSPQTRANAIAVSMARDRNACVPGAGPAPKLARLCSRSGSSASRASGRTGRASHARSLSLGARARARGAGVARAGPQRLNLNASAHARARACAHLGVVVFSRSTTQTCRIPASLSSRRSVPSSGRP
jgi:hypothetical protein